MAIVAGMTGRAAGRASARLPGDPHSTIVACKYFVYKITEQYIAPSGATKKPKTQLFSLMSHLYLRTSINLAFWLSYKMLT